MGKKTKDAVFQLIDNYTLFHLRFAADHVVMVTAQPMIRNAWSKEVMAFISGADLFG